MAKKRQNSQNSQNSSSNNRKSSSQTSTKKLKKAIKKSTVTTRAQKKSNTVDHPVFGYPNNGVVPRLTLKQTVDLQFPKIISGDQCIKTVILLAVSVEGGLEYNQKQFTSKYHPVFKIIYPDIFQAFLNSAFQKSQDFINNYQRVQVNFFTVSQFFKHLDASSVECPKKKLNHFFKKQNKRNEGFSLREATQKHMLEDLQRLTREFNTSIVAQEDQMTEGQQQLLNQMYEQLRQHSDSNLNEKERWESKLNIAIKDEHFETLLSYQKLREVYRSTTKPVPVESNEEQDVTKVLEEKEVQSERESYGFVPVKRTKVPCYGTMFSSNESRNEDVEQQKMELLKRTVREKGYKNLETQNEFTMAIMMMQENFFARNPRE